MVSQINSECSEAQQCRTRRGGLWGPRSTAEHVNWGSEEARPPNGEMYSPHLKVDRLGRQISIGSTEDIRDSTSVMSTASSVQPAHFGSTSKCLKQSKYFHRFADLSLKIKQKTKTNSLSFYTLYVLPARI